MVFLRVAILHRFYCISTILSDFNTHRISEESKWLKLVLQKVLFESLEQLVISQIDNLISVDCKKPYFLFPRNFLPLFQVEQLSVT